MTNHESITGHLVETPNITSLELNQYSHPGLNLSQVIMSKSLKWHPVDTCFKSIFLCPRVLSFPFTLYLISFISLILNKTPSVYLSTFTWQVQAPISLHFLVVSPKQEIFSLTSSLSICGSYLPQASLKTQNFQEFTFWLIHCFVIVLMYYFVLVLMYFSFLQLCCCCC